MFIIWLYACSKCFAHYFIFHQEEDDKEYESEISESDVEDSDISIDENDEVKSDDDDDGPRKKKRVVTKAYKV